MQNRHIKILLGVCISIYMLLVCFNNITDYETNHQFVCMVAGMDDVFSKANTGWRALHGGILCHAIYLFIIAWEILVAAFVCVGTISMIRKAKAHPAIFNMSKKGMTMGLALGVMLWFGLFIAIGGEWFLMWQSKTWNGQQTAFFLTICFMLFLVYFDTVDE